MDPFHSMLFNGILAIASFMMVYSLSSQSGFLLSEYSLKDYFLALSYAFFCTSNYSTYSFFLTKSLYYHGDEV